MTVADGIERLGFTPPTRIDRRLARSGALPVTRPKISVRCAGPLERVRGDPAAVVEPASRADRSPRTPAR